MKIMIDSNVIISAVYNPNSKPALSLYAAYAKTMSWSYANILLRNVTMLLNASFHSIRRYWINCSHPSVTR